MNNFDTVKHLGGADFVEQMITSPVPGVGPITDVKIFHGAVHAVRNDEQGNPVPWVYVASEWKAIHPCA